MALILATNLSKEYPSAAGVVRALRGIDLEIDNDDYVAIMGPSGSGKTTLMNLLGLLDNPSSGRLVLDGQDVTNISADRQAQLRNRKIGFVFQSYNLLSRSNALENVELPLVYAGVPASERKAQATEMLEAVGLKSRIHHWPAQLSGGEQQRVAIARSMITNPAMVLADEPTGALDTKTGETVMELFADLNAKGTAVILVTHDEKVALHAKRIIRLSDGQIVSDETGAGQAVEDVASIDDLEAVQS